MKRFWVLSVFVFSALFFSSKAHANLGIAGFGTFMGQNYTGGSNDGQVGFGGGFLWEFVKGKSVGFELNLFFNLRKVKFPAGTTGSFGFIEAPVLVRLKFNRTVRFGIGGYVAQGVTGDFTTASQKKLDYGLAASLGANLGSGRSHLFLEARYYLGFAQVADPSGDMKWGGFKLLLGYEFGGR